MNRAFIHCLGHLKIAVQIMPEEKRNTSNPSPIEFREPGQEEVIWGCDLDNPHVRGLLLQIMEILVQPGLNTINCSLKFHLNARLITKV